MSNDCLPRIVDLLDEGVVFLPERHLAPVLSVGWWRTGVRVTQLHPHVMLTGHLVGHSLPVIFIIYYLGCQLSQVSVTANQTYRHIRTSGEITFLQIVC